MLRETFQIRKHAKITAILFMEEVLSSLQVSSAHAIN